MDVQSQKRSSGSEANVAHGSVVNRTIGYKFGSPKISGRVQGPQVAKPIPGDRHDFEHHL